MHEYHINLVLLAVAVVVRNVCWRTRQLITYKHFKKGSCAVTKFIHCGKTRNKVRVRVFWLFLSCWLFYQIPFLTFFVIVPFFPFFTKKVIITTMWREGKGKKHLIGDIFLEHKEYVGQEGVKGKGVEDAGVFKVKKREDRFL